jgi:hypothetical protein
MITPVVRELKRVSPHGMRLIAPVVPVLHAVAAPRPADRPASGRTAGRRGDDPAERVAARIL